MMCKTSVRVEKLICQNSMKSTKGMKSKKKVLVLHCSIDIDKFEIRKQKIELKWLEKVA